MKKGSFCDRVRPWEGPPEVQGRRKAAGSLRACVLVHLVVMFAWDEMCNGGFPFICDRVREDCNNKVNFLSNGWSKIGVGFTIPNSAGNALAEKSVLRGVGWVVAEKIAFC